MNIRNILNIAQSVIGTEPVEFRKCLGSTIEHGQVIVSYSPWKSVRACVQPGIVSSFGGKNLSEKDYKEMGLDWTRTYYTIWLSGVDISTVQKRDSSDQVRFLGKTLNILQCANWLGLNGWKRCYCVERVDEEDGNEQGE